MLTLVLALVGLAGFTYLIWDGSRAERRRTLELAALGLVVSGEQVSELIARGWCIYRVDFGREEYWAISGPPQLDASRRIFRNGKKLHLGRQEPALLRNQAQIHDFYYRT